MSKLSLDQVIHHVAAQHAQAVASGLDQVPKIVYQRHVMDPSQYGSQGTRPQGWWLMFCKHYRLLSDSCGECKRRKSARSH